MIGGLFNPFNQESFGRYKYDLQAAQQQQLLANQAYQAFLGTSHAGSQKIRWKHPKEPLKPKTYRETMQDEVDKWLVL